MMGRPQITIGRIMMIIAGLALVFSLPAPGMMGFLGLALWGGLVWGMTFVVVRLARRHYAGPRVSRGVLVLSSLAAVMDVGCWKLITSFTPMDAPNYVYLWAIGMLIALTGMLAFVLSCTAGFLETPQSSGRLANSLAWVVILTSMPIFLFSLPIVVSLFLSILL